ncbi:MAG: TIGR01906 family membrane protein [Vagococcus sp.]|uniref:TIGR01906 family membrane protein n=1 Tax=Vagococcus sp. TaxID=1933889 RepID=UPI002FC871AB
MKQLKRISEVAIVVLFLLTLAITLTINSKWLYLIDINSLDIMDYLDVTRSELVKNYEQLMNYLNFFWINPLKMTDFPVSESGALHFYEVKRLFQINYAVLIISIAPSFMILKNRFKTGRLWLFIRPFSYLLAGLIALIIFMAAAFDIFFVKFHEVFFNNDAWVFNPVTDPIILALPEEYFMHCFILFFVLFIGFLCLVILLGKNQLKKLQK